MIMESMWQSDLMITKWNQGGFTSLYHNSSNLQNIEGGLVADRF